MSRERALDEPGMAVLSALVHGNRTDGTAVTLAAFAALSNLPERFANVCYDLICASLNEAARRALEDQMEPGKYEYQSDFARHYFGEGRARGQEEGREEGREEGQQEGRLDEARTLLLALADRHGAVNDELRRRVIACVALEPLRALAVEIAGAFDHATVEGLLARLPTVAARDD